MRNKDSFANILEYINNLQILFKPTVSMEKDYTISLAKKVENEYIIEDFACSFYNFETNTSPFMFILYPHYYKILVPKQRFIIHLKTWDEKDLRLVFDSPLTSKIDKLSKIFTSKEEALGFVIEKTSNVICENIQKIFAPANQKPEGYKEKSIIMDKYILFSNENHDLNIEFCYKLIKS